MWGVRARSSITRMAGTGLGRIIVEKLLAVGRAAGCYKTILDCSPNNIPFYLKSGFKVGHSPVCMALYFDDAAPKL